MAAEMGVAKVSDAAIIGLVIVLGFIAVTITSNASTRRRNRIAESNAHEKTLAEALIDRRHLQLLWRREDARRDKALGVLRDTSTELFERVTSASISSRTRGLGESDILEIVRLESRLRMLAPVAIWAPAVEMVREFLDSPDDIAEDAEALAEWRERSVEAQMVFLAAYRSFFPEPEIPSFRPPLDDYEPWLPK